MAQVTFTFNGVSSTVHNLRIAGSDGVRREILAPSEVNLAKAAGRAGAYFMGKSVGVRSIEIDVSLNQPDRTLATQAMRDLAAWLHTDEPATLVFSDEPDKEYYVLLEGDTNIAEAFSMRRTTLKFVCPDPYIYAAADDEQELLMDEQTITTDGNARCFPRFRFPIESDLRFLRVQNEEYFVQLGQPDTPDDVPVAPYTALLADDCSTTSGWSLGVNNVGGIVTGTLVSNGYSFSPQYTGGSLGSGAAWHGPCLRKALTLPVQDFAVTIGCRLNNIASPTVNVGDEHVVLSGTTWASLGHASVDAKLVANIRVRNTANTVTYRKGVDYNVRVSNGVSQIQRRSGTHIATGATVHVSYTYLIGKLGRVSVYLLDDLGTRIGHIQMTDGSPATAMNSMIGYVRDTRICSDQGLTSGDFNNFSGALKVSRVNGTWVFYGAQIDSNGTHYKKRSFNYVDPDGTPPSLAMIEVEISQYGAYSFVPAAYIDGLLVQQVNSLAGTDIPILATTGDVIEIDCETSVVRKNGEPFMSELDLGSTFFTVNPAGEVIKCTADDIGAIDTDSATITMRPRWL